MWVGNGRINFENLVRGVGGSAGQSVNGTGNFWNRPPRETGLDYRDGELLEPPGSAERTLDYRDVFRRATLPGGNRSVGEELGGPGRRDRFGLRYETAGSSFAGIPDSKFKI